MKSSQHTSYSIKTFSTRKEMSKTTEDSIGGIERAISEKYLKSYSFDEFTCKEEISCGSFGKIFRANQKGSDTVMVLKYSCNPIEEIVNEVNSKAQYIIFR
jgi:hypothetical protein